MVVYNEKGEIEAYRACTTDLPESTVRFCKKKYVLFISNPPGMSGFTETDTIFATGKDMAVRCANLIMNRSTEPWMLCKVVAEG